MLGRSATESHGQEKGLDFEWWVQFQHLQWEEAFLRSSDEWEVWVWEIF